MSDIKAQLTDLMARQLGLLPRDIREAAHLVSDIGMDSLDCIELVMCIEEDFEIEIHDEEAERCATVGDVLALIARKAARQ